ncbi:hypothetical protein WI61_38155 [Burkholderia cepacia]|nr:hypothetical protein WI61_38155 [Burkholderia cepacia]KVB98019.1 hypothetical protein WI68_25440 [Burkholderia cepacia]KVC03318.1 hypothetical protein WI66_00045 [Burkholderia cepacia]
MDDAGRADTGRAAGQTSPKSSLLSGIDASSRSSRYQPTMRRHRAASVVRSLRERGPDEGRVAAGDGAVSAVRCARQ